jgi:hypothetical protein
MNKESDEPPSDSGLFLGGVADRLLGSSLLFVSIKSPACKSIGFSRCNRFSGVRDNYDISSEPGFRVGPSLCLRNGIGDFLGSRSSKQ